MAAFSHAVQTAKRRPLTVVTIGPADWSDTWPDKPTQSVAVGLAAFSEANVRTCLGEAIKQADELLPKASHADPDWIDARNDALMIWALSLSLCDVNDPEKTYFEPQDEDIVASAFRPQTVRHLWDELERASIAKSPIRNAATDDEIAQLSELLAAGLISKLVDSQAIRLRKLASFMLDELVAVADIDETEEAEAVELP